MAERSDMRWLGAGLVVLGGGIATSALLGPLVLESIRYRVSEDMLNQITGGDAVSLAIVAPVSVVVGVLALRRHPAAPVLALGPTAYAAYMFSQLVLGAEYLELPGNNERFFPLQLGLFVLAGALAVVSWRAIDAAALRPPSRRLARSTGWLLLAVSAFLVIGLHLPGLVDALSDDPTRREYLDNPTVFWVVKLMDLGIVVPAALTTGVGLLRGLAWARKAMYALVGWLALLGSAVAAMGITMLVRDDPDASVALTSGFAAAALGLIALALALYRPLLESQPTGE